MIEKDDKHKAVIIELADAIFRAAKDGGVNCTDINSASMIKSSDPVDLRVARLIVETNLGDKFKKTIGQSCSVNSI